MPDLRLKFRFIGARRLQILQYSLMNWAWCLPGTNAVNLVVCPHPRQSRSTDEITSGLPRDELYDWIFLDRSLLLPLHVKPGRNPNVLDAEQKPDQDLHRQRQHMIRRPAW
jgi:hypothetical protein